MLRSFFSCIVVGLFSIASAFAENHPEHPKPKPSEEVAPAAPTESTSGTEAAPVPTKKKKGKKKEPKKGADDHQSWNKSEVEKNLTSFIDTRSTKAEGMFVVQDNLLKTSRKLTLDKIHSDKIVLLEDGTSFVCADFKDANGDRVDVDFFMTPNAQGAVKNVSKVQIHKINGAPRYTYVEKNGKWTQVDR